MLSPNIYIVFLLKNHSNTIDTPEIVHSGLREVFSISMFSHSPQFSSAVSTGHILECWGLPGETIGRSLVTESLGSHLTQALLCGVRMKKLGSIAS
jgi:hypothetical protein